MYLAEKSSEHPIAAAICSSIQNNIPTQIHSLDNNYKILEFKNRNGEGIVANI